MTLEVQVLASYMHTHFTCCLICRHERTEIKKLGKQVYFAETDFHQAFRILPVTPQDYALLCFIGRKSSITLIVVWQWVVELQRNLWFKNSNCLFNFVKKTVLLTRIIKFVGITWDVLAEKLKTIFWIFILKYEHFYVMMTEFVLSNCNK
jgi:hypothetical protein